MQEKIVFAGDVLVRNAVLKLKDGDVILTFAFSSVVLAVLLSAYEVLPPPPLLFVFPPPDR